MQCSSSCDLHGWECGEFENDRGDVLALTSLDLHGEHRVDLLRRRSYCHTPCTGQHVVNIIDTQMRSVVACRSSQT